MRRSLFCRIGRFSTVAAAASLLAAAPDSRGRPSSEPNLAETLPPVQVIRQDGYPELHVDGKPFFLHAATFFYYRVPRDLWEFSLEQHRALGINTIVLPLPWNWHQPNEGTFDFEGRTNPRRDLRSLLKLITEKQFKLVVRVGANVDSGWLHGGYPEWLVARPADEMAAAQAWLVAVARELAGYQPGRRLRIPAAPGADKKKGAPKETEIPGPLLFVVAGDIVAQDSRPGRAGQPLGFDAAQQWLRNAGLDVLVVASSSQDGEQPLAVPFVSGWYLLPPVEEAETPLGRHLLTPADLARLFFTAALVKTQPEFPPFLAEFQAGWSAPANEAAPPPGLPANTLLSSRLALAQGLKGISYSPLQDGIAPAAYSAPGTNQHYRWDAALDVNASPQPRARAVLRNSQLLAQWGEFLAASHLRADFGLVIPPEAASGDEETGHSRQRVLQQILDVALLAGLSGELVDAERQPTELLLRYPLLLLPVPDPAPATALPARAQRNLVDFVRQGGTLLVFPRQPRGEILAELWRDELPSAESANSAEPFALLAGISAFGRGRVMFSSKDFYSWADPAGSLEANAVSAEAAWATGALRELLTAAGIRPAIRRAGSAAQTARLLVSQLVSNKGSEPLGRRSAGAVLVSVTNLSYDEPAEETLEILSPHSSAQERDHPWIPLRVSVPPRESLLLPVRVPLCTAAKPNEPCTDQIAAAGAELLRAVRDGKDLELTFYTPAKADVVLRLAAQPRRIYMEDRRLDATWEPPTRLFKFQIPRGAAPEFLRTVSIRLRYEPRVPEKPKAEHDPPDAFTVSVVNPVKLPLADDAWLASFPPLLTFRPGEENFLILEIVDRSRRGHTFKAEITGPVRGSRSLLLWGGGIGHFRIKLEEAKPAADAAAGLAEAGGVLTGKLALSAGEVQRSLPLAIVPLSAEGSARYRFDFDRDGAEEWVLENAALRLIASPEAGGRLAAVVDKSSGLSVAAGEGISVDSLANASADENPPSGPGLLAHQPFEAQWEDSEDSTGLLLRREVRHPLAGPVTVEKRVQLTGESSFRVKYHLAAASRNAAVAGGLALTTTASLPVLLRGERTTQFCWPAREPAPQADSQESAEATSHCEVFQPHGQPLRLPEGVRRLEVRTPGRLGLAVEWTAGAMVIEMTRTLALLKLTFPAFAPQDSPASYQVRYHVLPLP